MSLKNLLKKKRLVILGLNSGTSADGIDLAAVRIDRSRGGWKASLLDGRTRPYPNEIQKWVLELADSKTIPIDSVVYLDQALGQFFGRCATAFMRRLEKKGIAVDVIGSHGQTVRHLPKVIQRAGFNLRGSLQLGSLEQISIRADRPVVGDFRQADIALGHEGAPITVAAMQRLFATPDESRLIVNIGGMANYFFFPARRSGLKPAAADCGPGNSLSDILSQRWFGERFDRNGRRASSGRVHQKLLTRLWAEPFFNRQEKSTGRESFGVVLANKITAYARKYSLARHDVMATTAELTVAAIAHQVRRFVRGGKGLNKLYLTGGGWRNKFFRTRLGEYFDGVEICTVVELGYDPDLVEAAAYAVMAEACVRSEAMPAVLGRPRNKVRQPVLGRLVQPARME